MIPLTLVERGIYGVYRITANTVMFEGVLERGESIYTGLAYVMDKHLGHALFIPIPL